MVSSRKCFFAKLFLYCVRFQAGGFHAECFLWFRLAVLGIGFVPLCRKHITSLREGPFQFRDASHIVFERRGISSREPVSATFTLARDGAVFKMLLILLVLLEDFAFRRSFLMVWSLQTNVTFFGWHSFSSSLLLSAFLENEREGNWSWLPLSVFLGSAVVARFATLIVIACGFSLVKLAGVLYSVNE